jgi:hypothetical protein
MTDGSVQGLPIKLESLVDYYYRLEQKAAKPSTLLDPSWHCDGDRYVDRQAWYRSIILAPKDVSLSPPLFTHIVERLVLLIPQDLQKLLCGIVLLSRRDQFRRCIDGTKIRTLHSIIGAEGIRTILNGQNLRSTQLAFEDEIDWTVPAVLSEGAAHLREIYTRPRQWVLDLIEIALPRNLARIESTVDGIDSSAFENLVLDVHQWYPELKWLFG